MSNEAQNAQSLVAYRRLPFLARALARLLGFKSPTANLEHLFPDHLGDAKKTEIMAKFMLAEFNTLIERARDFDQINASRTNFYLIIVAAVGAGLGASTDLGLPTSDYLWLALTALSALLVLGSVTFYYTINSTISSIKLYRFAGRIRCWFAEQAADAVPFLPFLPTDTRPRFTTRFWTFRAEEAMVAAINGILLSGIVAIVLYQLQIINYLELALAIALVVWPLVWLLQRWFFQERMKRAERKYDADDIHFQAEQYRDRYRALRDDQVTS